ncbi:MAG: hypothetical protein ACOC8J_21100, partial [Ralstonia sp.]
MSATPRAHQLSDEPPPPLSPPPPEKLPLSLESLPLSLLDDRLLSHGKVVPLESRERPDLRGRLVLRRLAGCRGRLVTPLAGCAGVRKKTSQIAAPIAAVLS